MLTMIHCVTVLSSRTDQFLPRLHDVWDSAITALRFGPDCVSATACLLLQEMCRYSDDFLRPRFAEDVWPNIKRIFQRCEARIRDEPGFAVRRHAPLVRLAAAGASLLHFVTKTQPGFMSQKLKIRTAGKRTTKDALITEVEFDEMIFADAIMEVVGPFLTVCSNASKEIKEEGLHGNPDASDMLGDTLGKLLAIVQDMAPKKFQENHEGFVKGLVECQRASRVTGDVIDEAPEEGGDVAH